MKNNKSSDKPEGMSSPWKEVVSHLWETLAAEDVIADTEADMQNLKIASSVTPNDYAKSLWTKTLKCNHVYNE